VLSDINRFESKVKSRENKNGTKELWKIRIFNENFLVEQEFSVKLEIYICGIDLEGADSQNARCQCQQ
jgi:hypothetical protein